MDKEFDAIVLGAGAAGLFCAGSAAALGLRVAVLEQNPEPGRKILISGGGRCNFTNKEVSAKNFISQNPHFCKSALAGFTPQDFIALVEQAGITWHEKTLGQLFCDGSAEQILDMLIARLGATKLRCGGTIASVRHDGRFHVDTSHGTYHAPQLVVATGGLSIPKIGATNFAHRLAQQFGHKLVEPRPALAPLVFSPDQASWMQTLAGVSAPVVAKAGKISFAESLLFTHRGLSGPAILQISSYLRPGEAFSVDFAPGTKLDEALLSAKRARPKAGLKAILSERFPARLAAHWAEPHPGNMADLQDQTLKQLGAKLNQFSFKPAGTEGFAKAEVTVGGIDTNDLSSRDCASKLVPGLFFVGEAVDVTGWLGGYNFQWAWASGHAAAKGLLNQATNHT